VRKSLRGLSSPRHWQSPVPGIVPVRLLGVRVSEAPGLASPQPGEGRFCPSRRDPGLKERTLKEIL
jgi:hypothetical protein